MQGETLKVKNENIQALFLQVLAYRSIRTQPESMGSFVLGDGHRACAVSAKSGAWNRVWGTWSGGRCRLPIPCVVTLAGGPCSLLWPSDFLVLIGWAM